MNYARPRAGSLVLNSACASTEAVPKGLVERFKTTLRNFGSCVPDDSWIKPVREAKPTGARFQSIRAPTTRQQQVTSVAVHDESNALGGIAARRGTTSISSSRLLPQCGQTLSGPDATAATDMTTRLSNARTWTTRD